MASPELTSTPPLGDDSPPPVEPEQAVSLPASDDTVGSFVWELIQTLVLAGLLIVFFRTFIFQNYIVEGSSMVPTLQPEQRLIVGRINYIVGKPQRGDVVVFQFPGDPRRDFVKRIIGLPGETVSIEKGQVYINGKPLPPEHYVKHPSATTMPPTTLGEDEYWVMGDNRAGSSDSRSWGPLPARNIIGKAWLIYYPFQDFGIVPHEDLEPLP